MLREELTKNIVRGITDKIEATTDIDDWAEFWGFTRDDYEEFLDKTLEQESILDKIRAEIEKLNPVDYGSMFSYESHNGARDMQRDILDILDNIDKESEG